jgi:hypothetical protein
MQVLVIDVIKKLLKFAITMLAISWFAKKMHHHCYCNEKQMEPLTTKLRRNMDK